MVSAQVAQHLGDVVGAIRRSLEMNQSDFGRTVGLDQVEVSRYENGKRISDELLEQFESAGYGPVSEWKQIKSDIEAGASIASYLLVQRLLGSQKEDHSDSWTPRYEGLLDWCQIAEIFFMQTANQSQGISEMLFNRIGPLGYYPNFERLDDGSSLETSDHRQNLKHGQTLSIRSVEKVSLGAQHTARVHPVEHLKDDFEIRVISSPTRPYDAGYIELEITAKKSVKPPLPGERLVELQIKKLTVPVPSQREFEMVKDRLLGVTNSRLTHRPN